MEIPLEKEIVFVDVQDFEHFESDCVQEGNKITCMSSGYSAIFSKPFKLDPTKIFEINT